VLTVQDDGSIELLIERMKALSQIDTDDMTYEELTERFEAVKTSTVDCKSIGLTVRSVASVRVTL